MRLLFATDHRFETGPDGCVYTLGGKYPYALWRDTYLKAFDEVVVVGRGGALTTATERLSASSGPGVSHRLVGGGRGLGRVFELGRQGAAVAEVLSGVDAVVARLPGEIALSACTAARRAGVPHLAEVVASAWDGLWHHGSPQARAYAPVLELRTRRAVAAAPLVRYVTERFLQDAYPATGRTFVASNVQLPATTTATPTPRHPPAEGGSPMTFGTIGSLVSRMKGIHIALRALAAARAALPPFVYRVLGEGDPEPYRRLADQLGLSDRVAFDGVLPPGPAVSDWLAQVDLYLQPSFQEGLPRALIEAMDAGCLALASTCGGIPELLPPERLHRPGDVEGLRASILRSVRQPAEAWAEEGRSNQAVAARYRADRLAPLRVAAVQALADATRDRRAA